jgi:hypothetical protein
MRNKFNIILLCLAFFAFSAHSQQFGSNVFGSADNIQSEKVITPKKAFSPDVSVSLGSSFTSFGRGYDSFGTYIMPEFAFPLTEKFAVKAGIGYSTLFYPNSGFENQGQSFNQYGSVYVSGIYQVTEKFTVAGAAYKTFPLNEQTPQANPQALDFSNEGIIVDMQYKVTNNFSINAGFSYQKQNPYHYYYNSGGFNSFGSPFGNPMFGHGF